MTVASLSDVGRVRDQNEDHVHADGNLGLLVVADGMGGHVGGETASAMATQTIAEHVGQRIALGAARISGLLAEAIEMADTAIRERAEADPGLCGMGTTVVAALCNSDQLQIAHVGDSRAYLLRGGKLRRLTEDHSLVNDMILHGQITPRDARKHHLRNYLTRSVGARSPVSVDLRAEEWSGGDLLLLCSDGLTGPVEDKAIQGILTRAGLDLDRACRDLVRAAKSKGGHDNISVVIARRG